MSAEEATKRPIIVIKKKVSGGGHHGGAWKVAYADFVTAMMSLFIVLWLLNSTPQVKKAVAGYFNDPKGTASQTGSDNAGSGPSVSVDKTNVEKLKEKIEKAIVEQADLSKLSKQVEITVTGEGLRIELIEEKGGTFFESGSATLSGGGVSLLKMLAAQLKPLPNKLLIEGHTDAQAYSREGTYTNWELSSDRANAARRLLQEDGVGAKQISQVRGFADQMLKIPGDPMNASNRRVALMVHWDRGEGKSEPQPGEETESKAGKAEVKAAAVLASKEPGKTEGSAPAVEAPKAAVNVAEGSRPTTLSDRVKGWLPGKK